MRTIKILLSLCVALLCIFYAAQNIANLQFAYGAVDYVMGNVDHQVYPNSFGPSITHPVLVWIVVGVIITLEFLAGLLALKGTWDLWSARKADQFTFDSSKKFALLGAGVGMLVWFGLFHVIGGAFFQMWQTEAGDSSLRGAFWLVGLLAFAALFITQTPDD